KGREHETQAVGRELKVQIVVNGTFRQLEDDFIISVSLVDVADESEVWGYTYPRVKREEIQDLQDKIARDVAARLRLQLTGEEDQRLTKRWTKNSEAYLLYLEGRHHEGKFTEEEISTAKTYFQRALEKDINYAPAHVGLGDCCLLLGALHLGPKVTFQEARQHYLRAEGIDKAAPGLAQWRAVIYMLHDWDWRGAENVFETEPIDFLDPFHAFYLASQGKADEALKVMKEYGNLGALPPAQRNELAMAYNWAGKYDDAVD